MATRSASADDALGRAGLGHRVDLEGERADRLFDAVATDHDRPRGEHPAVRCLAGSSSGCAPAPRAGRDGRRRRPRPRASAGRRADSRERRRARGRRAPRSHRNAAARSAPVARRPISSSSSRVASGSPLRATARMAARSRGSGVTADRSYSGGGPPSIERPIEAGAALAHARRSPEPGLYSRP